MSENGLSCIDPRMTVLDIVSGHRETEAVFKSKTYTFQFAL
jgi:hypothetical protein